MDYRVRILKTFDDYYNDLTYSQLESPEFNWVYFAFDIAIIFIEFFIPTDVVTHTYLKKSYKNNKAFSERILVFDSKLFLLKSN